MYKVLKFSLWMFSLLIFSCSESESTDVPDTQCVVTSITNTSTQNKAVAEYDQSGRIQKILTYDSAQKLLGTQTYMWNSDGTLSALDYGNGVKRTVEYIQDYKIIRREQNGTELNRYIVTDRQEDVDTVWFFTSPSDTFPLLTSIYGYTNGNKTSSDNYYDRDLNGEFDDSSEELYEYDDQPNYYGGLEGVITNFNVYLRYRPSANNLTKITFVTGVQTQEYKYTTGEDGYPTQADFYVDGSQLHSLLFEYSCN